MPYYRSPQVQPVTKTSKAAKALHIQSLLTYIIVSSCTGQTFLSNIPVWFGHAALPLCRSATGPCALLNLEFASYAFQAMSFCWAVYLFSNKHFSSMIQSQHLPFHISLAWDTSRPVVCSLQSLRPVPKCSVAATIFSNTSGRQGRPLLSTAISSIHIVS
jgi:hypothetical protein